MFFKKQRVGYIDLDFLDGLDVVEVDVVDAELGMNNLDVFVDAWVSPAEYADKNIYEMLLEDIKVAAHSPVKGVGFKVIGYARNGSVVGKVRVNWIWTTTLDV